MKAVLPRIYPQTRLHWKLFWMLFRRLVTNCHRTFFSGWIWRVLNFLRQSNLLRYWFRIKGFRITTEKALQEFLRQVRTGATGSRLVLRHEKYSALARVNKEGIFIVPGKVDEHSRDLKVWDWPREERVVTESDLEIRSIQVSHFRSHRKVCGVWI